MSFVYKEYSFPLCTRYTHVLCVQGAFMSFVYKVSSCPLCKRCTHVLCVKGVLMPFVLVSFEAMNAVLYMCV